MGGIYKTKRRTSCFKDEVQDVDQVQAEGKDVDVWEAIAPAAQAGNVYALNAAQRLHMALGNPATR